MDIMDQCGETSFHKLLKYAWEHSVFYREFYASHGINEKALNEVSVRDLPFVTKKILMESFDAAVTDSRLRKNELEQWLNDNRDPRDNFHKDFVVVHSSGSSGSIGIFVYDRIAWQIPNGVLASNLPQLETDRSRKTRVAFYLASHGHFAAVSMAVRISTNIYDSLILSVLDTSDNVAKQLNDFQPHQLGGYSSVVSTLAQLELKGRLHIRPQRIIVSGDTLTDSMERIIYEAWKAPIHVVYSASESTCLALKKFGQDQLVAINELNIMEVLDEDNQPVRAGGEGRAVVTNLYNYTLPIVRYELGDQVVLGTNESELPLTTFRQIRGRATRALPVLLNDGSLDILSHHVLGEFYVPGVERFQFVSKSPSHVEVHYVGRPGLDSSVSMEFQRVLEIRGATRTTFAVLRRERITNDSKTGKFAAVKIEHSETHQRSESVTIQSDTQEFATSNSRNLPSGFSQLGQDEVERSVIARFERQVTKYPDRIAVKTKETRLTYAGLNESANRLAQAILGKRGQGQEPIALLLENGAPIIAAIFGVLKAGKLYMPLDPAYPQARIKALLEESQAGLILTNSRHLDLANESAGSNVQVINVDDFDSSLSSENPQLPLSADNLACILYTSGSTGEPKGVVHNHRNILHKTMEYTNALRFCSEDRIALLSPCTFSLSVGFIFGALLNGACLYPVDVKGEGLMHLADWFSQEEITVYNSVPTVFRNFIQTLSQKDKLPKLRLIHLGGEPVTAKDVELYKTHFSPDCVLLHHVGSNETGTIAQCFIDKRTPVHGNTAPAGHPAEGSQILVLDENGDRLGFNRAGEIAVQSRYLAVEYWRKPGMTRAAFLPDPTGSDERIYRTGDLGLLRPDGSLEHYGRKDFQVKIRGQRVEVIEIDMALSKHAAVNEAVTVAHEDALGDKCLVTYVVPATKPAPTSKELRSFLQQRLPDYMVPSSIIFLDAMPLTPNGKLDRQALPPPDGRESDVDGQFVAPQNPVEAQIANIWCEVLRLDRVGIHDDFFDLGGHSLSATEVLSRAREVFSVNLPFAAFLAEPTVAAMASIILQYQADEGRNEELVEAVQELQHLSEEEAQRLLSQESLKDKV
jgi:amino acid adenylation domain-containing protein